MNWRSLIPNDLKLQVKLWLRNRNMRKQGLQLASISEADYPIRLTTTQPIFESHLFENKVHNLGLAGRKIEKYLIQPGETFSFWTCVEEPSLKNGFKVGRNIVGGEMQESVGGGLCQIAGALYHTALKAGLTIKERHNHTVDYYTEDKRFTPLGADAAVVYGNKDLIFTNQLQTPMHFTFSVSINQFVVNLHAKAPIQETPISFVRTNTSSHTEVKGINQNSAVVNYSKYTKVDLPS